MIGGESLCLNVINLLIPMQLLYMYLPSDSNPRTKRFWFKIKTDQSINMCTWNNFKLTSILKENLQDVSCFTKIVHKGHFSKSKRTYLNQTTCKLKKRNSEFFGYYGYWPYLQTGEPNDANIKESIGLTFWELTFFS